MMGLAEDSASFSDVFVYVQWLSLRGGRYYQSNWYPSPAQTKAPAEKPAVNIPRNRTNGRSHRPRSPKKDLRTSNSSIPTSFKGPWSVTAWWFQNISLFSPWKLGKWSNFTHIFQRGWFNHQPGKVPCNLMKTLITEVNQKTYGFSVECTEPLNLKVLDIQNSSQISWKLQHTTKKDMPDIPSTTPFFSRKSFHICILKVSVVCSKGPPLHQGWDPHSNQDDTARPEASWWLDLLRALVWLRTWIF